MVLSRRILERATRECITSPQIAITSPSSRPVAADGQRVQQRLGRMSWAPSPALITEPSTLRARSSTAPERVVPHHQDVRVHGVERHGGIHQRLALADRGRGHRHVHDVGAKPFSGQFSNED